MKLTGEEIIAKIEANFEPYEFEEIGRQLNTDIRKELGKVDMVADESFTNGDAWRVLYFKDHDVYVRQTGFYDSYESFAKYEEHDYDVVVPFERTIIDYKKVN